MKKKRLLPVILVILICLSLISGEISVDADKIKVTTSGETNNDNKLIQSNLQTTNSIYTFEKSLAGVILTLEQYVLLKRPETKKETEESKPVQKKKVKLVTYYATANVNIRKGKGVSSEKVGLLKFSKSIKVVKYVKNGWSIVRYKNADRYIKSEYLSIDPIKYKDYDVPAGNSFKAYMPYTAITSRSSSQWKLQQKAYTGTYGIRQVNGRFCVAIGTYYGTEIGRKFDIVMKNGTVIPCITSDVKADAHTDPTHRQTTSDGSIVEFIVDSESLKRTAKFHGDISYCEDGWIGEISKFRIYL